MNVVPRSPSSARVRGMTRSDSTVWSSVMRTTTLSLRSSPSSRPPAALAATSAATNNVQIITSSFLMSAATRDGRWSCGAQRSATATVPPSTPVYRTPAGLMARPA